VKGCADFSDHSLPISYLSGMDTMDDRIVNLRNGGQEDRNLVAVTMIALESLLEDGIKGILAAYDLVGRCKDSSSFMFPKTEEELKNLSLLQSDGLPHDSIRNIVLSSVRGEGMEMSFGNPASR